LEERSPFAKVSEPAPEWLEEAVDSDPVVAFSFEVLLGGGTAINLFEPCEPAALKIDL
jgi:hypothetical protein